MKPLREFLDKIEPNFAKNKFLHTLYDAVDTLLFQPRFITKGKGVHIRDGVDLKRTMFHVIIALQLCVLHGIINIGHQHYLEMGLYPGLMDGLWQKAVYGIIQLLPIILIVHVVGLGIEIWFAARKGHSVEEGFLVSGVLIPLIMPPDIPLWMVSIATAFAVLVGKEAFGGTGMNILNVALMARVFIFFAYPTEISGDAVWVAQEYSWLHEMVGLKALDMAALQEKISLAASMGIDLNKELAGTQIIDGFTGATPLALAAKGGWEGAYKLVDENGVVTYTMDSVANSQFVHGVQSTAYSYFNPEAVNGVETVKQYSVPDMLFGFIPGSIGEMSKVAVLFGVGVLIATGIGSWRVMLSMALGMALMAILFNVFAGPNDLFLQVPWYYHFIMGSFMFGMAYMATDPVTASQTNMGKIIYGFLIGSVGLIIRVSNPAYPEGWMLAILLMNVMAPLIDHYVIQQNIQKRLSRA